MAIVARIFTGDALAPFTLPTDLASAPHARGQSILDKADTPTPGARTPSFFLAFLLLFPLKFLSLLLLFEEFLGRHALVEALVEVGDALLGEGW